MAALRFLDVGRIERDDRIIGLHNDAVGADGMQEALAIEGADRIADPHHGCREIRQQEIERLRAHEDVRPGPFAERACEAPIEQKRLPLLALEAIPAGADGQEIRVAGSLEEMAGKRHAILKRYPLLLAG